MKRISRLFFNYSVFQYVVREENVTYGSDLKYAARTISLAYGTEKKIKNDVLSLLKIKDHLQYNMRISRMFSSFILFIFYRLVGS